MTEMDRRAVACIRACEGVPLTILETIAEKGGFAKGVMVLMEQAKELLSALEAKQPVGNRIATGRDRDALKQACGGCGAMLLQENAWMEDGCPCNSPAGVNNANLYRWRLLHELQQKDNYAVSVKDKALRLIASIIEQIEKECAADISPRAHFRDEVSLEDLRRIHTIAKGQPDLGAKAQVEVKQTIHILCAGMTLCGMQCRVDVEWPPGHAWVSRYSAQAATCSICVLQHRGMGP